MRSFLIFLVLLVLSIGVAVAKKEAPGAISGTVNYCGLGGLDGMRVYVPGKMFTVITDESGQFQLQGLPVGEYTLSYRSGDKLLNQNRGVQVLAGQTTTLGVIVFCDRKGAGGSTASGSAMSTPQIACESGSADPQCKDADGDGVVAALDCNDNDAKVYPGAVELCDGVDNNCSGQIDDNVSMLVGHGFGACDKGVVSVKSCTKGFSDCDGDPANGCETDVTTDNDNCGSCGNACASSEMCGLGFC